MSLVRVVKGPIISRVVLRCGLHAARRARPCADARWRASPTGCRHGAAHDLGACLEPDMSRRQDHERHARPYSYETASRRRDGDRDRHRRLRHMPASLGASRARRHCDAGRFGAGLGPAGAAACISSELQRRGGGRRSRRARDQRPPEDQPHHPNYLLPAAGRPRRCVRLRTLVPACSRGARAMRDCRARKCPSGVLRPGHPTAPDGEFRRDIACSTAIGGPCRSRY